MYPSTSTILSSALLAAATMTSALPAAGSSGWQAPHGPTPGSPWGPPGQLCLSPASAQYLVDGYSGLLTAYTTADAENYLSSTFTDWSDSINFLTGTPLGSVTFPNRAAFEQGQGAQPAIGFTVLNIDAVTCDTIAFRWVATLGPNSQPIKGINIMVASNSAGTDDGWQIETNYSEFNSATWDIDVGGQCAPPSP